MFYHEMEQNEGSSNLIAVIFVRRCTLTYDLLPTTYNLQPTNYHLWPTTYNLPPTTYHLQPTTYNLPPTTYHLQPTTYSKMTIEVYTPYNPNHHHHLLPR